MEAIRKGRQSPREGQFKNNDFTESFPVRGFKMSSEKQALRIYAKLSHELDMQQDEIDQGAATPYPRTRWRLKTTSRKSVLFPETEV